MCGLICEFSKNITENVAKKTFGNQLSEICQKLTFVSQCLKNKWTFFPSVCTSLFAGNAEDLVSTAKSFKKIRFCDLVGTLACGERTYK